MPIYFLIGYHFLFFFKFYRNPYQLCTSELASTFFPHWIWVGRQLRKGIFPAQDDIYYNLPGSIPFLSTFYPPSLIMAWLATFLKIDSAFRLYAYFILSHYLLASLFAYYLFGNLFCAITLIYSAYIIKPNTPCFVFSMTWIPLALKGGYLGGTAWGLSLFGGYYPILVYIMPLILLLQPLSFLLGLSMTTPQLLPFLGYFKRSVRNGEKIDRNFGRLPWWKLKDLFIPTANRGTTNDVHYAEVMIYMGIVILFVWHWSWWWCGLVTAFFVTVGLIPAIQRIPARSLYLVTFALTYISSMCLQDMNRSLLMSFSIFQAFLLLRNSSIYPSFPFSQWWNKPSRLYSRKPKAYGWPFNTGYLLERRISNYEGAFRLAN